MSSTDHVQAAVLSHIRAQIVADSASLIALRPQLGWQRRVEETAEAFIPSCVRMARNLLEEVQLILNSPRLARETWQGIRESLGQLEMGRQMAEDVANLEIALKQERYLLTLITGETISGLVAEFLCREFPQLRKNNRSTYPDLYFATSDYSQLPKRARGSATGPALRGNRPSSVPDGIEIKSQAGQSIRVDCHHPHQGLHLVLTCGRVSEQWLAHDLLLAYLTVEDYVRAARNTTATTEKFSFGGTPFISVVTGNRHRMELKP